MPLPKELPRWIFASGAVSFDDNAGGVFVHLQNADRQTETEKEYFEFRMAGPFQKHTSGGLVVPGGRTKSRGWYLLHIEFNVIASVAKDDVDAYRIHDLVGIATTALQREIPVKKHKDTGPPPDDLGCLFLRDDVSEPIRVLHWGQVDTDIRLIQATITGRYRMNLCERDL